jgi:hypothetical protein
MAPRERTSPSRPADGDELSSATVLLASDAGGNRSPQTTETAHVSIVTDGVTSTGRNWSGKATTSPTATEARRGAVGPASTSSEPAEGPPIVELVARRAPPWLVSAIFHMVVLIVMGLVWSAPKFKQLAVQINAIYSDQLGEQLDEETILIGKSDIDNTEQVITPDDLQPVDDPFAAPPKIMELTDGTFANVDVQAPMLGIALRGRSVGMKEALLKKYGGNALSEAAVEAALQWLLKQQRKDGSWSLLGPYRDASEQENAVAATAMAMLAFQGAGHTHQGGTHQKAVARGLQALLRFQEKNSGCLIDPSGHPHDLFYAHGQATIALCELYGMTGDSAIRPAAEQAVEYCVQNQGVIGGWRYEPKTDSDTSVTGWIVMALQSARMAGLDVPSPTLANVTSYLDEAGRNHDGVRYGYQVGRPDTLPMTAEALLCRQYLGWTRYDKRLIAGADYLAENLPVWEERDLYYWYYGTQVMHHMEGQYWTKWNSALRGLLVSKQETSGREKGSWDPYGEVPDRWSQVRGGRLYATCLSVYMLEVYYRHLPLYSNLEQ